MRKFCANNKIERGYGLGRLSWLLIIINLNRTICIANHDHIFHIYIAIL